ncbi:MAG: phosphoribosylamine--glycine ligase [Candidatus Daviesbacteria bacterium]|nr:phosphoribosylamine--glycine ligase [Candidatus Daviesbacteria bacterium]
MNKLKTIMIIDGGGRGATLVDKYGQSKRVGKILVVPGNDLMQINTKKPVVTYQYLKTTSIKEILEICKKEQVDLVDVAQDNAVEAGLADTLLAEGIKVVGPTKKAGQLEWDKAWARGFMKKYQIPSPDYHVFSSTKDGIKFVNSKSKASWFVKASGLAEGKGAIPAKNGRQAIDAIKQMARFGKSGETYLLEQWLIGEEFSAFALCDGKNFQVVGFAQDHKQVFDGDEGPNTGGMGCVSNPLIVDENIRKQVKEIFKKAVDGLKIDGRPYKGVLYLGGIVIRGAVFVIEFNARWGDPEAEVILPSIKNDLYEVSQDIINGTIGKLNLKIDKKVRVVVAAVAKGYPVDYQSVKGKKVFGIDKAIKAEAKIYGAGIKKVNGGYMVAGGRILFVMDEGKNVIEARERAYRALRKVNIEGNNLHYRTDIGWRDVARLRETLRRGKKG